MHDALRAPALPGRDAIESAARFLAPLVPPTPQYLWPQVAAAFGTEVWLKHENHTPIGAFKARSGAMYFKQAHGARARLPRRHHGDARQSRAGRGAWRAALQTTGDRATCRTATAWRRTPPCAPRASRWSSTARISRKHARKPRASRQRDGLHMVPAFHPDLVLGVTTYWAELFRAVRDLDVVYVPIGQGSGICAAAAARNVYSPGTKIVGVVSAHAACFAKSFAARRVVEAPVETLLGDGMACRKPDADALAIMLANVSRIVEVTDAELAAAMRAIFSMTHNVAEGAGAAAFAAAWRERESLAGQRVGIAVTGGNVDSALFADVLAGRH